MKIILIVIFLIVEVSFAETVKTKNYLYFGTSNPTPLASNLIYFSDKGASTYYGDIGIRYDNCKVGFKCINVENLLIAIKDICVKEMSESDKWKINNTNYRVSDVNTIYLDNIKRKLFNIQFSSKTKNNKTKEGVIVYSKDKGIESFTYNINYKNRLESYESYHLLSNIGVFNNKDCQ